MEFMKNFKTCYCLANIVSVDITCGAKIPFKIFKSKLLKDYDGLARMKDLDGVSLDYFRILGY